MPPRHTGNVPALISWALCVWLFAAAPTCAAVVLWGLLRLFKWSMSLLIASLILPNSVLAFSPLAIFARVVASVKVGTWSLGARFGNVPNLAPSDQVPTFTEATTLANIVSGEKASTLFGKIKLAISKLIDHLNNRSNPHNTTAAQVGAAAKSHTHNAQDINAGTLSVLRGGTGRTTFPSGQMLYGTGSGIGTISWRGALYSNGANNPWSGTLPVAYGGTGCTSLTALATALATADSGLGKIVTSSYRGTGGYGTNNKKSLTFSAPPKLLVVMPASNTSNGSQGGFIALRGISSSRGGGIMDDVSGSQFQLYYTWDGNTVTWYSPNNEYSQQNLNGMTYYYFAIL